ncbi:crotonase/enoyl-CoA hydratase family protein [Gordonia sp. TBRC 11910]|uniref:Crotonase/enoyl-CoA hydratase family protein n=1 Tax=Gordonia asplenii TaxID=2725283 RepID=A0A848L9J2_9ACTN|nr:crotonase/enoyl-CoA hydratase family protein [Gordonia asplenii]NMO04248.1 crotonase/enoyl-CoA hydratase family protein [Gordonia asplenii]
MSDLVTYDVINDVAHVVLNRPDKLNALTLDMLDDLEKCAHRASKDKSLRAVLLYGAGDSFSAGLDFGSTAKQLIRVAKTFVPRPLSGNANGFQGPAWAWRSVPVPVIAVVTGHCFGGGLQIALGADFRIAASDASFSIMESKWGLIPDMSASASLSQLVGIDVAKKLTMTAEVVDAATALRIGLVTEVHDDPHAAADALVAQIVQRSPDAVASAKWLFERTWEHSSRWTFPIEQFLQAQLLRGKNSTIARKAGMARAVPEFVKRQF